MKIIIEDLDTIMKAHGLDNEEMQEALIKQMTMEIKNKIREERELISTSDNTTKWTTEVRDGITVHQSKPNKDI
jgi:hypothetical protein